MLYKMVEQRRQSVMSSTVEALKVQGAEQIAHLFNFAHGLRTLHGQLMLDIGRVTHGMPPNRIP
eukprot:12223897-Karenia_brevis.AAC.1